MQYPIPRHLLPFLQPEKELCSETQAVGAVRCKCGGLLFTPYVNDAGTIAAARCGSCGGKIMLFHAGKHGWDAFVAKAADLYELPTQMHGVDTCPECGKKTRFALKLDIASAGKEEFIRLSGLEDEDGQLLKPEDWTEAFDVFRMDIVCPECCKTTESVIDIETS